MKNILVLSRISLTKTYDVVIPDVLLRNVTISVFVNFKSICIIIIVLLQNEKIYG